MHNLFWVYFFYLYMFRAYLCPSSGGTTVCIQQLVPIFLFRRLSVGQMTVCWTDDCLLDRWLSVGQMTVCWTDDYLVGLQSNQDNRQSSENIISTNGCIRTVVPPDDGSRYVRNMYRLTKYSKNKLYIKLGSLYTIVSRYTINKKTLYYSYINFFVLHRIKMGQFFS
jgi:hypothetical protein